MRNRSLFIMNRFALVAVIIALVTSLLSVEPVYAASIAGRSPHCGELGQPAITG